MSEGVAGGLLSEQKRCVGRFSVVWCVVVLCCVVWWCAGGVLVDVCWSKCCSVQGIALQEK